MYLLQTNCSRGSALEGYALGREGGGPRGHKRACLSIRLYQKNTVATALKIRDGVWEEWRRMKRFTGGNKINERWIKRKRVREEETCQRGSVCIDANASVKGSRD